MLSLLDIKSMNESIQKSENQKETAQTLIFNELDRVENRSTDDKKVAAETKSIQVDQASGTSSTSSIAEWCDDEIRLLVKGVKVIAVGTRDRWDVIASFIEEHSRGKFKRTGKEVLTKTKEMQKMGNLSKTVNQASKN